MVRSDLFSFLLLAIVSEDLISLIELHLQVFVYSLANNSIASSARYFGNRQ